MGAPDPREETRASRPSRIHRAGETHWAFQPLGKPAPPAVKDAAWARNDIDRFILAGPRARWAAAFA